MRCTECRAMQPPQIARRDAFRLGRSVTVFAARRTPDAWTRMSAALIVHTRHGTWSGLQHTATGTTQGNHRPQRAVSQAANGIVCEPHTPPFVPMQALRFLALGLDEHTAVASRRLVLPGADTSCAHWCALRTPVIQSDAMGFVVVVGSWIWGMGG